MQPQEGPLAIRYFNEEIGVQHQIYEPLTIITKADIKKQVQNKTHNENFTLLFRQPLNMNTQGIVFKDQSYKREKIRIELAKDTNVPKVIQNQIQKYSKASSSSKSSNALRYSEFSFNADVFMAFNETPTFKQQLLSPLSKFCRSFRIKMEELYKLTNRKERYREATINTNADPTLYNQRIGYFFTGLATGFKNKGCVAESLFFYRLAVYCQPFNPRIWEEYCEALKKFGYWKQAKNISKTAFLFNPSADLAQSYFLYGDKINTPAHEMRGLLSSLKHPQNFQKAITESAKYQIKHRKVWRGLSLLFHYCQLQEFKSNICQSVILLAKIFQFFRMEKVASKLLTMLIDQKHSKYESFILYLQLLLRKQKDNFSEKTIQFLNKKIINLAPETRYRICLDIAQAAKQNTSLWKKYYYMAVQYGKDNCQEIINQKRVRRHIYMSILSNLCISPSKNLLQLYPNDDHLKFLTNKAKYVKGQPLVSFIFQDWKYYLHYALGQNLQVFISASQTFNQGRIFAEYLHAIRLRDILKKTKNSIKILKLWRDKIEEAPKSGELWCEGARIYIQLEDFDNAKKCLQAAIHFTPQYGDSFFELLKIFLSEHKFFEINQLRKNFLMSEPFYGNVFSFLRLSRKVSLKESLIDIWSQCQGSIKNQLYLAKQINGQDGRRMLKIQQEYVHTKYRRQGSKNKEDIQLRALTACELYNKSIYNPLSPEIRQKLFLSYELIQNKFSK